MKLVRAVLLMSNTNADLAVTFAQDAGIDLRATVAASVDELALAFVAPIDLLLAFGSGVIVPRSILETPDLLALNIHPASVEFPGRDPHHFAHYYRARTYGATLHFMSERVDSGPIISTEIFDVPDFATPSWLLSRANDAGKELMRRFFCSFANHGRPLADLSLRWASRKSSREDFLEMCRVHSDLDKAEFLRRLHATAMPGYSNLFIDLHGYRFRLEGEVK